MIYLWIKEIVFLIFMDGKDFLNYIGFWTFEIFIANKILSSVKYPEI